MVDEKLFIFQNAEMIMLYVLAKSLVILPGP